MWKWALFLSTTIAVAALAVSFYGVYCHNQHLAYLGLAVVAGTCVAWWVWSMVVINTVWKQTNNTVNDISEITQAIKQVKQLVEEYKNLSNR